MIALVYFAHVTKYLLRNVILRINRQQHFPALRTNQSNLSSEYTLSHRKIAKKLCEPKGYPKKCTYIFYVYTVRIGVLDQLLAISDKWPDAWRMLN